MIKTILKYQGTAGFITPCLVGPTGSGKTSRVLQTAKELGLPVTRLLLGTMLAEDVLGLPKVNTKATHWTLPDWAAKAVEQPYLIFLDELDKARSDTMSSVLTLLAEHQIRDVKLHPETKIAAAMQPVDPETWNADETGKALTTRLAFIRTPYEWEYFLKKYRVDFSDLPVQDFDVPVSKDPNMRQIEWLIHVMSKENMNQEEVEKYARLMWHPQTAKAIAERLFRDVPIITPIDLVKRVKKDPSLIEKLPISDLLIAAEDLVEHIQVHKVIERIWIEGTEDDASAFLEAMYRRANKLCEENPNEANIFGEAEAEEVANNLLATIDKIADAWSKKGK